LTADCQNESTRGADYSGSGTRTDTGRTCQQWSLTKPHNPYGLTRLGDHNFCRNPDGEPRVWCFTTDPNMRWEYCDVPFCKETPNTITGPTTATTISTPPSSTEAPAAAVSVGPVCSGSYRVLRCQAGERIQVRRAFFGRSPGSGLCQPRDHWTRAPSCHHPAATAELEAACGGRRSCLVSTRTGRRGVWSRNPCYRQAPYVELEDVCLAGEDRAAI
jgi:hypothetical protein